MTRQVATDNDTVEYTVTIDDAVERFASANVAKSPRTLQRYCDLGELVCKYHDTLNGRRYLIKSSSIDIKIQELQQILASNPPAFIPASRDMSRQPPTDDDTSENHVAPDHDISRQTATGETPKEKDPLVEDLSNKVEELTKEIKELKTDKDKLASANALKEIDIKVRDQLLEHMKARETNYLDRITGLGREKGQLEMKLMALGPGRSDGTNQNSEPEYRSVEAHVFADTPNGQGNQQHTPDNPTP